MNIVQILHIGNFNTGSVHQMYALSLGLRDAGHHVTVVGKPHSQVEQRCAEDGLPFESFSFRNEVDPGTIRGLASLFRREKTEVVHVHKGLPHTLALTASFFTPVPCFVANRGVSFPLTFWNRVKYRSRKCHRIVCVCDAIREVVIRTGRVSREKVVTVYAGTDLSRFNPDEEEGGSVRREFGYGSEHVVVCQIGLREWRGWKTLVEAFARVAEKAPEARLLLVAAKDRIHADEIMQYAAKWGVGNMTRVEGCRADMPAVAAAQDIAVDLSYAGPGITGTLREAMAMGRPVVCSSAGGNPELVLHGETGWVVPPRAPEETAEAILRLVKDRALRNTMGQAGCERARNGFSMKIRLQKIQALYREILTENSPGKR